jgi:hydroxymethylpyrimidine/phosphomethylpyrimidine kinase
MLDTVSDEIALDGIKIGVLSNAGQVKSIASFLRKYCERPIVFDPVTRAKNGQRLLSAAGLARAVKEIFPLVFLLTPNLDEASQLVGRKIANLMEMQQAAKTIAGMGPKHVLIKGGHLPGEPVDLLYDGNQFITHEKMRLDREVHGTGCAFSSLILAFIVLGYPLQDAFFEAERIMDELLKASYRLAPDGYWYTSLTHIAASKKSVRRRPLERAVGRPRLPHRASIGRLNQARMISTMTRGTRGKNPSSGFLPEIPKRS